MIEAILTLFLSGLYLFVSLSFAYYVWQQGSEMREERREGKRIFKEYVRAVAEDKGDEYLLAVREGREEEYLQSIKEET